MIICIDEIHAESSRAATKLRNKLKSRITEEQITINIKKLPEFTAKNYADYVFLSNHADAIVIEESDRRFNVAPHRNEKTIVYTAKERKKIADEMPAFANFLKAYDADFERAATAINNAAKADMKDASSTAIQSFFQQLPEGNFDSIYEVYDPHAHMSRPIPPTIANWIKESRQSIEDEGAFRITPTELAYLYQAVMGERDLKSPRPMKAQADRNNWTGYKQQSLRCLHGDTRRYQIRGWKYRIIDDNLAPALEILDTLLEHIGDPTDNKVVPFPEPMRVDDATDDN
jgi:hypothetical protein